MRARSIPVLVALVSAAALAVAGPAAARTSPSFHPHGKGCVIKTSAGDLVYTDGTEVTLVDSNGYNVRIRCKDGVWQNVPLVGTTKHVSDGGPVRTYTVAIAAVGVITVRGQLE
jgi:hypothetical protein